MKKLIPFILLLVFAQMASAQSIVTGKVVDENSIPLVGASVILQNTDQGTITDYDGSFEIQVDDLNNDVLEISYIGYNTVYYPINGRGNVDSIILKEGTELQSIEIVGRNAEDYNSGYSFSATKIAMDNKELPQAISAVTKEYIKDRQAFQLSEAVRNVSSVSPVSFYNHFNIRGVTQNQEGPIINGMRTNKHYFLQPLTQNLERVEVIKGPSSVTFASADPGGSINMVTKKPLKEDRKEVSFGVGSFSTMRGALDFTGPLNKEKTMLYRVNAAVQQGKSFRDLVRNDAFLISPSFSYVPNKNLAVNVEMIYNNSTGNLDRGQPILGDDKSNFESTPISTNLAATNDYAKFKELISIVSVNKKFSDNVGLTAKYMKQTWNEDLKEHRADGFVKDASGNPVNNLVKLRYNERQQYWETDNVNVYLDFKSNFSNGIENTFLVGYDLNVLDQPTGNGGFSARRELKDADGNPILVKYGDIMIQNPKAGYFDLNNPASSARNTANYEKGAYAFHTLKSTTHGAYIQNVTKVSGLTILLSLRNEWIEDILNYNNDNKKESASHNVFLPRVGLSYALTDKVNIYGTYLTGFQPQTTTTNTMTNTANYFYGGKLPIQYKPLESDLIELGAKGEFLNGRVKSSLAFFQINQKNVLLTEDGETFFERGHDQTRGFEIDLSGSVSENLQVFASYSYIDSKIKEDVNKDLIGERKENAPQNSANLWAKYSFDNTTPLKGFSFGLGVQYSGEKIGWYDRSLQVPAYTLVDAILYYKPNNSGLEFNFKVNNIFDQTHWTGALSKGRLFPGAPRNVMFSTNYRF